MKKIKFNVGKTSTGYDAYAKEKEIIVAVTTGSTLTELKNNALEAYNLYSEEKNKPGIVADQISFDFDLTSFFDFYKEINASAIAKRIGMNQSLLSDYINGKRTPSGKQVEKVFNGIKELGKELNELEFTN